MIDLDCIQVDAILMVLTGQETLPPWFWLSLCQGQPTHSQSQARPFCAVRRVVLAMEAAEAGGAGTGVAVDTVRAVGSVLAGVAGALVDVLLALGALEPGLAVAEESVDAIGAGAPVVAGVWREEEEM